VSLVQSALLHIAFYCHTARGFTNSRIATRLKTRKALIGALVSWAQSFGGWFAEGKTLAHKLECGKRLADTHGPSEHTLTPPNHAGSCSVSVSCHRV
jgi:hypothetical protein